MGSKMKPNVITLDEVSKMGIVRVKPLRFGDPIFVQPKRVHFSDSPRRGATRSKRTSRPATSQEIGEAVLDVLANAKFLELIDFIVGFLIIQPMKSLVFDTRRFFDCVYMTFELIYWFIWKLIKFITKFITKKVYKRLFSPENQFKTLNKKLKERVESMGLEFSEHVIFIGRGTRLIVHRVKRRGPVNPKKLPVFIQHGMLNSSADFLLFPDSLGIMAAKEGHDVWLGNFRGNAFSGTHFDKDPEEAIFKEKYWNFTFQNHGTEDLSAMIKEVLRITRHQKLHFIGHSMGTTALIVMLSSFPAMNDLIASATLLAPVYDLEHIKGLPWIIMKLRLVPFITEVLEFLGIFTIFFPRIVHGYSFLAATIFFQVGYFHFDFGKMLEILSFGPSGCSTKTILHCLQCHQEVSFRPYIYIEEVSFEEPLKKVTCPVRIWYSHGDWTAAGDNIKKMVLLLPNVKEAHNVASWSHFGHLDFLWGNTRNMNSRILKRIEERFEDHEMSKKEMMKEMSEVWEVNWMVYAFTASLRVFSSTWKWFLGNYIFTGR